MEKEILINVETDETRVAVIEDSLLVEIYIERASQQRLVGNIYKGRVENVLPGMQAAFVDIGLERNAFLYVEDAVPSRSGDDDDEIIEHLKHLSIKDLLHSGQEITVQVAKDPFSTKGARVTSHLTLPGRYLVLMPTVDYVGISRRIEGEAERERLRKLAVGIKPANMGLIVRTVAEGRSETELIQDRDFLLRLWGKIQHKARNCSAPCLVHRDLGLVYRVIRDFFSEEVTRVQIDSHHEYERVLELLDFISPELKSRVNYFSPQERPLFDTYGIESEIEQALKKKVWLKSGGYLVIDQTEALTVIDVNTGKFVGTTTLADTILRTNLEAAQEIARQIRLRNIGGIIIIDFIDMEFPEHRQRVVQLLHEAVKADRTKVNVLGLTQLGLVEMTRKKVRLGLDDLMQKACPYCKGRGRVLSEETMSQKVRRELKRVLRNSRAEAALVEVHPSVAALLIGSGGTNLRSLEKELQKAIFIRGSEHAHLESINIRAIGTRQEVEGLAIPVKEGQVLEVRVEEPHINNPWDGIARVEGYVINIEGAGKMIGEVVSVEIVKAFRTYAKAVFKEPHS